MALAIPCSAWAGSWSTCQTITAVSNYIAYSSTVYVILSPGIPVCNNDAPGAAMFRAGKMGVTDDSLKTLLASATAAYLAGKRIQVFYDESAPTCFSNVVSIGGNAGQCP